MNLYLLKLSTVPFNLFFYQQFAHSIQVYAAKKLGQKIK